MRSHYLLLAFYIETIASLPFETLLDELYKCSYITVLDKASQDLLPLHQSQLPLAIDDHEVHKTCLVSKSTQSLLKHKISPLVRVFLESEKQKEFNTTFQIESLYNSDPLDFTTSPVIAIKRLHPGMYNLINSVDNLNGFFKLFRHCFN